MVCVSLYFFLFNMDSHGSTGQVWLHFRRKIIIRLRQAVGDNCTLDSCIELFKSFLFPFQNKKDIRMDVLFVLLLVYTLDITF